MTATLKNYWLTLKHDNMNKLVVALFLSLCTLASFAQVTSAVDSTQIKIGSAFNLTVKATANEGSKVVFPNQQNIGPFEVLEQSKTDTVLDGKRMELIKKYTLTQFDEGDYVVPRLSVYIDGKNHQTNLFNIKVNNVTVDTLKQPMHDIKAQIGGETDTDKLWKYLVAIALCFLAGLAAYFIIKRIQNKNLTEEDLYKTPLERVTKKLQLLDSKRLVLNGDVKSYYSEMTDVIRDYIEEVFEIPAKESTTSEVIQMLFQTIQSKKLQLSKESINDLKRVLQTADLVKFAKSEPMMNEIEQDRRASEVISVSIDKAIPRFSEEQSERVKLRERRFKKRQQMRLWIPIGVTTLLLFATCIVYIVQAVRSGYEWSIFASNKSLYEREWVTSDYGFPAVILSTPEALTRVQMPQSDKEKQQSQTSVFAYSNLKTQLIIAVGTTATQTNDSINLDQMLKYKLDLTAKQYGAKDVTYNAEEFTQNGVRGIRGTGTLVAQNFVSGEAIKMQYDMYVFIQQNGIQEVSVLYKEGDEYGAKIDQRIIESIQLNVANPNE
ncbi:BatD family protein [Paenimyroides baculatum]|uniref:Protein BatD n=1 Tax=Paenimyroides baculatum TaxID=2608000 RepID=A0A5M6CFP3_9FLAO|nr:BatD family protein [Paenimyroides baculatum]KAA5534028.1 protein BatD [Paenimyroides baculatum]